VSDYRWQDDAACEGLDTNLFFDHYEHDPKLRPIVDALCLDCPVRESCRTAGIKGQEWGVWGGFYLEDGRIHRELNAHKNWESMQ